MKLYELTEAYQNIQGLIEHGNLTNEEIAEVINTLTDSIQEKAENIALMLGNMDADITAIKAEEERLYNRRKALENSKTSLKNYLEDNFKKLGLDKVKTATHTISLQNNPPSVNILDQNILPKDYQIHIDVWKPDKKKIIEVLKSGQAVPGVEMVQNQSLRIR